MYLAALFLKFSILEDLMKPRRYKKKPQAINTLTVPQIKLSPKVQGAKS